MKWDDCVFIFLLIAFPILFLFGSYYSGANDTHRKYILKPNEFIKKCNNLSIKLNKPIPVINIEATETKDHDCNIQGYPIFYSTDLIGIEKLFVKELK